MNKDVVYIEPEEDITDIISKIEASKSKIVAIVPPKKAGVFKSIVNIKLIMKTGANAEKTVVLVTTDPAIIKLAAATKMPVTKDLKSAPKIPEEDDIEEADDTEVVDVDEEAEEEPEEKGEEKSEEDSDDDKSSEKEEESEEEENDDDKEEKEEEEEKPKRADKKDDKKAKKGGNKLANSNNPVLKWIGTHQKLSIGIGVGFVLFIFIMIWAFAIAPAVTITLKLETVRGNFSESISFTDKLTDENVAEGKFYIEEKKIEDKAEVEFEPTGKKNVGEKASGELTVTYYFPVNSDGGTISIKSGTSFTNASRNYATTADASIRWDGDVTSAAKDCENYKKDDNKWKTAGCKVSTKVSVAATDSGAAYNLSANASGWSSPISGVSVTGNSAISGGTDKTATVVQQSDIEKAIKDLTTTSESAEKDKLLDTLTEGQFAIESSYKQVAGDPVSAPEVGKEVEEGKKAKLTVTTTATIFVMDETKLKEFITEKAKLEKGQKIYEMDNPFVENFVKTDEGYLGKLKTSYRAGSGITENEVVDTIKGKGIGTAKRDLFDNYGGIKTIDIATSVPWVTSIPGNPEKITVIINVEE